MKNFIKESVAFIIISFSILNIIGAIFIKIEFYPFNLINKEIIEAIIQSKKEINTKSKILIIGDSVSLQMFKNENNDSIYSLSSNVTIGIIGQYLILNNSLQKNKNQFKKVYLIATPTIFSNNINSPKFSYHNFLKPFYNSEYKSELTETALVQIKKIPLYFISSLPIVRLSNFIPYYSPSDKSIAISKLSEEYLKKIVQLTKQHNIELKIISCPFSDKKKSELEIWKEEIRKNKLFPLFSDYLNFVFLPNTYYKDDFHFKDEYINEAKNITLSSHPLN